MPATKPLGNFEVLGIRRRGFQATKTPIAAAVSLYGRNALAVDASSSTGQIYSGYTPTIYAAPAALGSGSGASEANAMSLAAAVLSRSPGDIVGLVPGTFSGIGTQTSNNPIFKVTSSGTALNPIIFVAKYPAVYNYGTPALLSEIRSSNPTAPSPTISYNTPVIGAVGADYVRFIGLYANQTYAPPRPSNGTFLANESDHVWFEDCVIDQIVLPDTDNFNAMFMRGSNNFVIRNCRFSGGYDVTGDNNHNPSAITTYGCLDFLIEHNELEGVCGGIFIKGSHFAGVCNSGIIRYNKSSGASQSFAEIACIQPSSSGVQAYQNLSIRDRQGIVFDDSTIAFCTDISVYSNTIVDAVTVAVRMDNGTALTNCVLRDNVLAFTGATSAKAISCAHSIAPITSNYNLFSEAGGSFQADNNGSTYTGLTGVSGWQTGSSKDANSTEESPGFTNAGADNYRRAGADTSSSTGGKRGCYITGSEEIGVEAA